MITPAWTTVPLTGDVSAALSEVPAATGVAQIVGPQSQNLMIGKSADMRRWAASHLGLGKAPPKGVRPPVDLRPIATAVLYAPTSSQFQQRLVYERFMARHVPLEKRRDLKVPAFLRLDLEERFPRLLVVTDPGGSATFGPFRDRAAAQRALATLHKLVPLRPCDFVFEPHPELPLGTACLYAQVRTCAAPCLCRVSEAEYHALANTATRLLLGQTREADTSHWLPAWVRHVGTRAVILEGTPEALEVYPVVAGSVMEERGVVTGRARLGETLEALDWTPPATARGDWPWLSSWLHTPRRSGQYLPAPWPDLLHGPAPPTVIP